MMQFMELKIKCKIKILMGNFYNPPSLPLTKKVVQRFPFLDATVYYKPSSPPKGQTSLPLFVEFLFLMNQKFKLVVFRSK